MLQLIGMEELVLKKLSYELTVPTAKIFLRRLLQVRVAMGTRVTEYAALLYRFQQDFLANCLLFV